jgi:hypothetical protein
MVQGIGFRYRFKPISIITAMGFNPWIEIEASPEILDRISISLFIP